ncbi:hypothetical protein, partial [Priestia aryabhattai]|uniref:hypothetical protein n=1 Tax=Priestia aryabhattai TaxID=412384 RepID=UPI000C0279BF
RIEIDKGSNDTIAIDGVTSGGISINTSDSTINVSNSTTGSQAYKGADIAVTLTNMDLENGGAIRLDGDDSTLTVSNISADTNQSYAGLISNYNGYGYALPGEVFN